MYAPEVEQQLRKHFSEEQSHVLARLFEATTNELVKAKDFSELKKVVEKIGERIDALVIAQEKTEQRIDALATAQEKTAQAQEKTEQRLEALVIAQEKSEQRIAALTVAQEKTEQRINALAQTMQEFTAEMKEMRQEFTTEMREMRREIGGLGKSVGYALENEAYRALPAYLRRHWNIELTERMIRTEIGGEEINILARGKKNGTEVIIVGEACLRLDKKAKFAQLERKVKAAMDTWPGVEIVPVVITHFATAEMLQCAETEGIIVVQSFQWTT